VSLHEEKKDLLAQIASMREWVLEAEHIFDDHGQVKQKRSGTQNRQAVRRILERLSHFGRSRRRTKTRNAA